VVSASQRPARSGIHLGEVLDDHRLVLHVVGAEVIGEVELGRGAGLYANAGAGQQLALSR
jgi:hypothetical protein